MGSNIVSSSSKEKQTEIAMEYRISTVKTHVNNIYAKLRISKP